LCLFGFSFLIAGTDNKIDRKEIKKAIMIAKDWQRKENALLIACYKKIG